MSRLLFGAAEWQVQVQAHRVDLRQIESALERCCHVRECAIVPRENGSSGRDLVAYVALVEASNMDEAGEPESREKQIIPERGIKASLDRIRERVAALKPARLLEVGCGSGALLFQSAPYCQEYVATDRSGAALEYIEENLSSLHGEIPRVRLRRQATDDFSGIAPGSFDVVVINSVQNFPNIQYLVNVLEKAVNATHEGGIVLLGEVHNLVLPDGSYTPCHTLTPDPVPDERELMINPAFFDALARRTLGIRNVEILLSGGDYAREWPRFRYDVVLNVGEGGPEEVPVTWQPWEAEVHSLTSLRDICNAPGDIFAFQGVPDKRIYPEGVEPEMFWSFAAEAGFEADVLWSAYGEKGAYDVVLRRGAMMQVRAARPFSDPMPWDAYANLPVRGGGRYTRISQWRQFLQQHLPEYMIPAEFIIVESLPRTANGQIDRRSLRRKASGYHPFSLGRSTFPAAFGARATC